jgi:copper(I)-binding protein
MNERFFWIVENQMLKNFLLILGVVVAGIGAAVSPAQAEVEISDLWIREAPPGAHSHAGYLAIYNAGSEEIALVSAVSDDYRQIMFHRTAYKEGVSSMQHLESVIIPAGETLRFEPGGMHLMLMGPRQLLEEGDRVTICFIFSDGEHMAVPALVKR